MRQRMREPEQGDERTRSPGSVKREDALSAAQRRFAEDPLKVGELAEAERDHLGSQTPVSPKLSPQRGSVVIDRDGDAWRRGTTMWICLTAVDGAHVRSVARLSHSELVRLYGPIRMIGADGIWRYLTIRGHR